jgi:hypothetical protein
MPNYNEYIQCPWPIITFIGHDVINERIIELLSNLSSTDSLIGLCTLDTRQFNHPILSQCLVIKGIIKGQCGPF